ncbi:MAG: RNB domain-containing ribonuclease [Burkholderiales bacterium]|nr:RNB domain-containing ribonuclease [Burkholderiales bacterium]
MNVLYEEDGGFKVGAILSETDTSLQVEAAHGKRSKIKAAAVLLRFDKPALAAFLEAAGDEAAALDLDFLWQVAPADEFGFTELAAEYCGRTPAPLESAAMLVRLYGAPMYFYRKGRGRFRRAPEDALKAALASVERKKREALQIEEYAGALARFELPEPFRGQVAQLLFKPDRQSVAARALEAAATATGLSPVRLLSRCGAIGGPLAVLRSRFEFEHFPRGTGFGAPAAAAPPAALPKACAAAFSIDDAATTEIDDAFSVRALGNGRMLVGIHIAAPALGFGPDSELGQIARARLSTVYMPGDKITMLPPDAVDVFTLAEGRTVPCLSMYVEVEPADMAIASVTSAIESIRIAANLRHNDLDEHVTEAALEAGSGTYPFKDELALLWRLAKKLEADRGRPSVNANFRDYNFTIDGPTAEDAADARVAITPRRRGAPLDKIVSELMILVNHTWGRLLADRGAAAIYRVKTGSGLAGKVRMTTGPAPHIGLGVTHYAWSSSPLRRYVDLVNQWQLAAVLAGSRPPFAANSEALLGGIAAFDAAYTAYAGFQDSLERYWCLRWLQQEGFADTDRTLEAVVWRDGVRLDAIPLGGAVAGMPSLGPGARVLVRARDIDLWAATVNLVFAGEIAAAPATDQANVEEEANPD